MNHRTHTIPAFLPFLFSLALTACNGDPPFLSAHANAHDDDAHILLRQGTVIEVPESSPLRQRLRVAAVENDEIERPLTAPGVVEALPEKRVQIAPPVPGRVVLLHCSLGDAVAAGAPLFSLDSADISSALAEHAKAQAAAIQARRDFQREKLLFDNGIAAKKDYEASRLAADIAASDARAAAALLAQLDIRSSDGVSRDYVLRSPISGRIVEMNGSQGGYWNDISAPILTVADLSTVWLTANIAERDVARLFVGQQAQVELDAYPEQPIRGHVRYIDELLDPETRTVKVRVPVDNADGRLRPGMFARVVFLGRRETALTVPVSALLQNGMDTRVYVEKRPFHFEARTVALGTQIGDRVEIVSGLHAGERIVIQDGVLLND